MQRDFQTVRSCYQTAVEYLKNAGLRRHAANCALHLGIILLLEGKMPKAKQRRINNRRIYELAEDAQGYSNCEVILAECDLEGV